MFELICSCCNKIHHDFDNLEFIGDNHQGKFYNCGCGSTLVIRHDPVTMKTVEERFGNYI